MGSTLRCDHPDIEEFVTAKQQSGQLRRFNLSVQITDAFVAAIRSNTETESLETMGAPALASLLVDHAKVDPVLRSKLQLLLASKEGDTVPSVKTHQGARAMGENSARDL